MQDFIGPIAKILRSFLARLADDSAFRSGFVSAAVMALFVGLGSRLILYWWGRALQFFKPTQKPATNPGPSPFSTCLGAIFALLVLTGIAIVALLVINELV